MTPAVVPWRFRDRRDKAASSPIVRSPRVVSSSDNIPAIVLAPSRDSRCGHRVPRVRDRIGPGTAEVRIHAGHGELLHPAPVATKADDERVELVTVFGCGAPPSILSRWLVLRMRAG